MYLKQTSLVYESSDILNRHPTIKHLSHCCGLKRNLDNVRQAKFCWQWSGGVSGSFHILHIASIGRGNEKLS